MRRSFAYSSRVVAFFTSFVFFKYCLNFWFPKSVPLPVTPREIVEEGAELRALLAVGGRRLHA
jgi:hypothetical protein